MFCSIVLKESVLTFWVAEGSLWNDVWIKVLPLCCRGTWFRTLWSTCVTRLDRVWNSNGSWAGFQSVSSIRFCFGCPLWHESQPSRNSVITQHTQLLSLCSLYVGGHAEMLLPRITIGMTNTWKPIVNCSSGNKSNDLERWRILVFLVVSRRHNPADGHRQLHRSGNIKALQTWSLERFGFICRVLYTQMKITNC